ncbi:OmpA family protein [Microtetraspora malaysiensis]|uniref:OmpA family protein n=1 Tax=Microtetraspora malaysiensis TaxID=161358 RepID=UPI0012F84F4F|nr:OmpA family protein [Microtetraspora malaysiensis]
MSFRTAAPFLALFMLSACGGAGDVAPPNSAPPPTSSGSAAATAASAAPDASEPAPQPALAETRSTMNPELKVEAVGLNRVKGKHLVVQLRLTNTGTKKLTWTGEMGDLTRPLGKIQWASGIGVLDAAARTWILPYKPTDSDSPCLCSDQERDGLDYFIAPGASLALYAVMPAPTGTAATTTVVTPVGPPMPDVPISDEPPVTPPGMLIPDPDAEPVTTVMREVVTPSEALDRSDETADDGKDLHVNLSSDVLFAVNKATLTPKAKATLARTAKLIDSSAGPAVKVEGHADSSGTDAINEPLSASRAQAVQRALSALITRKGVGFEAKGYGSRRPLYSNDSEEGRRRNRRVTVTFARPQAVETERAATSSTSATPGGAGLKSTGKAGGQPISMEVTGLRRLPDGLGMLTFRITNEGDRAAWFNELHHSRDWMSFRHQAAANVTLTDVKARRQYLPGRLQTPTDDGRVDSYCACSDLSGVRLSTEKFGPGQAKEFWDLFALPEDAAALNVKIANFRELEVPVQ